MTKLALAIIAVFACWLAGAWATMWWAQVAHRDWWPLIPEMGWHTAMLLVLPALVYGIFAGIIRSLFGEK